MIIIIINNSRLEFLVNHIIQENAYGYILIEFTKKIFHETVSKKSNKRTYIPNECDAMIYCWRVTMIDYDIQVFSMMFLPRIWISEYLIEYNRIPIFCVNNIVGTYFESNYTYGCYWWFIFVNYGRCYSFAINTIKY